MGWNSLLILRAKKIRLSVSAQETTAHRLDRDFSSSFLERTSDEGNCNTDRTLARACGMGIELIEWEQLRSTGSRS